MKLTFEIQGYTINIEETEEGVVVSAMQGDEEVEQFTLDLGGEESEDDDMDGMDDDLDAQGGDLDAQGGSQELPDTGEEFDEIPGGNGEEGKLESFMSFIRKRK